MPRRRQRQDTEAYDEEEAVREGPRALLSRVLDNYDYQGPATQDLVWAPLGIGNYRLVQSRRKH